MPILHFSGQFRSHPPLYNNQPLQPEKYFDANMSPDEVKEKVTGKVDPLQYFEFEFYDTYVKKVTYDDGTFVYDEKSDSMIGKEVMLKGMLVDVSPHLIRGRLFAGEIRVLDFIMARLEMATQSDLFTTVRGPNTGGIKVVSANFEAAVYGINDLQNEFVTEDNSRFLRESKENAKLKMYYNVNSFDFNTLEGKVYGYIGPDVPTENEQEVRVRCRRLLFDPLMPAAIKSDFNINDSDFEPTDDIERKDLEGTYEILEDKKLVILRYLNFMPFVGYDHTPYTNYKFSVVLLENVKPIPFSNPIDIEIVDEKSLSRDGGVCIFRIPENVSDLDKFGIAVIAKRNDAAGEHSPFMREPLYDMILKDNQKFLTLGSAKEDERVVLRIYKNNKLARDENVQLVLKNEINDTSPIVASWNGVNVVSSNGIVECSLSTLDLENCKEGVVDPILSKVSESGESVKISGELPWDRYYGNYVSLKIVSSEKPTIKLNIPVRVLHTVKQQHIESISSLDKEQIQDIVTKMLGYYARYYPWLHVQYRYAIGTDDSVAKPTYVQFLRIKEHLDFTSPRHIHGWHSVQGAITKINHFLERLERDQHDWKMMPRSRDFPVNGIEFLKAWKSSLITKVVQDINEAKEQLVNENKDLNLNKDLDIDDWEETESIIDKLSQLTILSTSLSDEQKKVLLTSKITLYNYMLEKLARATEQSGHTHRH
jgi:hypothetical protein